jgi:hypothetical protein
MPTGESELSYLSGGQRYQATVPDTLDLAERARAAVVGLTGRIDAEHKLGKLHPYAPFNHSYFNACPPKLVHTGDTARGVVCWGKVMLALQQMRGMSGSDHNMELGEKSFRGMLSCIDDDDLFYVYHKSSGSIWRSRSRFSASEDYACTHSQARVMLALMARHGLDRREEWWELIGRLARGLSKITVEKEGYSYFPDAAAVRMGAEISRPRSGWKSMIEPEVTDPYGYTLALFAHGGPIRALTQWHLMSGDQQALDTAGRLARFVMKPKHWVAEAEPLAVVGAEHAHFMGHTHAVATCLMGLLKYACVINDSRIKAFVRDGYEYMRNFGIARIGLFGETCTVGDMIFLAIALSDAGVGEYWDDVDQYVRNHLAALQYLDRDAMQAAVEAAPTPPLIYGEPDPRFETTDGVIERTLGELLSDATHPTLIPNNALVGAICCQGNGLSAYYFAWESIVRCVDGAAQVNVLLNRASPWLDVDSYLPYEGKVVIRNKSARTLAVRLPGWVDKRSVSCSLDGARANPQTVGNYLRFGRVGEKSTVVLEFPVVESTEEYTLGWSGTTHWVEGTLPVARVGPDGWVPPEDPEVYTCRFRGNTLMDISPRAEGPGYPLYRRDHYKKDAAPMVEVSRYVSSAIPEW